jgi:glycosyltransferase involved in cell wall biosynthesis
MKRPLESLKIFLEATKEAHLVFVGGGDESLLEKLRTDAKCSVPRRVHVLGAIYGKEKEQVIAGADGYWSFSRRENFNHSAVECLSAGLPLILSSGNDLGYELKEARCGWVDLASSIEACSALQSWEGLSHEGVSALGAAGVDWVRRELGVDTFNDRIRKILKLPELEGDSSGRLV